jgi:hypothetical protein
VDEYGENSEKLRKIIYDISVVYDLWFGKGEAEECTD